jgi:hypothetical protein
VERSATLGQWNYDKQALKGRNRKVSYIAISGLLEHLPDFPGLHPGLFHFAQLGLLELAFRITTFPLTKMVSLKN